MLAAFFRKLPSFKGKQRLSRFLFKGKILSVQSLNIKGKFDCQYTVPNISENIGFEIFIDGIYEPETIQLIRERLPVNGLFVDIGANIGAISIPLAKLRHDIQIVCLEAAPWIFNFLNQNIASNGLSIRAINKAISNISGVMVDFYSPTDKFGKGSMAPVFTKKAVRVDAITLDDLSSLYHAKMIDLIKIDVEGFESLAFEGGRTTLLSPDAPDIIFEFVDWAEELAGKQIGTAQTLLLEYGYSLFLLHKGKVQRALTTPFINGSAMILATKKV